MANKKNGNNLGLFAAVFAAIFGASYGIFSIGKNLKNRSAAMEQAIGEAEKLLQKGMTEDQIFNAFCADAARQTKRSVNDGEIRERVGSVVAEAKKRFEAGGAAVSTSGSLSSPSDLDGSIQAILLALQNALQKSQPILKFDDLYAKAKEAEAKNDMSDFQVFIQNQEYDTTAVWRIWMDVEQKLNQMTYFFDSSESENVQRKREEMAKLNSLPNTFKNLLVTRGRVLRHVRTMYNGKNKREETKKHEADELKVLMKLFQNDIDRVTAEMDVFNKTMERIKAA
jgi:hypothetical protein